MIESFEDMPSLEPRSLMMDLMKKVKRANQPQLLSYHEVKISVKYVGMDDHRVSR